MNQISLCNVEWKLKYFNSPEDISQEQLERTAENGWIPVSIPSNVQEYFCDQDLFYSNKLTDLLWTEEKTWVYSADFKINKSKDRKYFLRFKGVDYFSSIYLNGKKLAAYEGMYSDICLDIAQSLEAGDNHLEVVLYIPEELRKRDNMDRVLRCHSQYGWDFAPKLLTMGIWDDVLLEEVDICRIGDVQVKTSVCGSGALVQVQGIIEGIEDSKTALVTLVELKALFDGKEYTASWAGNGFYLSIIVENPRLWFPLGYGEPYLYDLELKLNSMDSVCRDEKALKVGIREITAVHCPSQKNYHAPLNFRINGQDIFIKGVNWVPAEIFPAKLDKQRYIRLLTLVKNANCNLIRVWGGGLIEKDCFYDLCDEMGLLVFQEFPMACFVPRRDDEFLTLLERECTAIIKKLRNHASIFIWCGGNELFADWSPVKGVTSLHKTLAQKVRSILPGFDEESWFAGAKQYNEPALRLLDRICKINDGTRPFHISSPLEGEGEVHGPWTYDLTVGDERYRFHDNFYEFWNGFNANLYSEVGCNAITNAEAYKKIIPQDEQWPLYTQSRSIKYHNGFSGAWTEDTWLTTGVIGKIFGDIVSLEGFIWASQFIQAEGLRYLLQEIERRRPSATGSIIWCFNEPWPNAAGSSLIDYYTNPKMGYYYVKNASEPIQASLRYNSLLLDGYFRGELWFHDIQENSCNRHNVEASLFDGKGNLMFLKEFKNARQGKLEDLDFTIDKSGPIYVKVTVTSGEKCIYKDYYAFVNRQADISMLMSDRQVKSIIIRGVTEENGNHFAVAENTSDAMQFNIGLHSNECTVLKNYMTFMPGEILKYPLDKYIDKACISAI